MGWECVVQLGRACLASWDPRQIKSHSLYYNHNIWDDKEEDHKVKVTRSFSFTH